MSAAIVACRPLLAAVLATAMGGVRRPLPSPPPRSRPYIIRACAYDGADAGPPGAADATSTRNHTRSTCTVEQQDSRFPGVAERRARLHAALTLAHGADALDFLDDPSFKGSAALRTYNAFVFPRTAGALEASDHPSRARVIADQIAFLAREYRAQRAEWLRNHDAALAARPPPAHALTLVLDNIRSAENVGNIFRLAECAGLERVVTAGITPAPPHPRLLKTAMGTAELVVHAHAPSALAAVRELRASGVRVCAAETTEGGLSLFDGSARATEALRPPLALVLGNEIAGVDARVLDEVDAVVHLPTFGAKNSLNVATAASAAVYELLRRWGALGGANAATGASAGSNADAREGPC